MITTVESSVTLDYGPDDARSCPCCGKVPIASNTEDFVAGKPGVYHGVPASVYHSCDFASASRLNDLHRSPLYCRHRIDNPDEPTPAMKLGTAAHLAILEPELFDATYIAADQCCAPARKGSPERCENSGKVLIHQQWYCGKHIPAHSVADVDYREVLSVPDFGVCRLCHRSVWSNPTARKALTTATHKEVSILWKDAKTGLLCKMRGDILAGAMGFDVKTTNDISRDAFEWTLFNRGYFRQAAFYLRGYNAAGLDVGGFAFIPVETSAPHECAVYAMHDEDLAQGDDEMMKLLARYAECRASGKWPGACEGIGEIRIPKSKRNNF